MNFSSTIWGGAHVHPSHLYDVGLSYRMNPLGSLHLTCLQLRGNIQSLKFRGTEALSTASLSAKASSHLQAPLTYNEAYIRSLSVGMELQGHEGCVNSVTLSPSENLLMTGSDDQCLCIYDTTDWSLLQRFRTMHRSNIFHAVFCPSNTGRVLSCGADGRTIISDLETIQAHFKCRYSSMATKLAVSPWWPDTAFVSYLNGLVGRIDTRMHSYDDSQPFIVGPCCDEVSEVNSISMHDRWPFLLALSNNSSRIFLHDMRMGSVGALASLHIPEVKNEECDGIADVSFSESGDMIAINYRSNNAYMAPWLKSLYSTDIPRKRVESYIYLSALHSRNIPSIALQDAICLKGRRNARTMCKKITFMENDSIICSGGDCGNVYFWRSSDGKLLHSTKGDSDITNEVLYSKSQSTLIVSGIDFTTKVMMPNGKISMDSFRYAPQEPDTSEQSFFWRNDSENQESVLEGNEQAVAVTSENAFLGSPVVRGARDVFSSEEHESVDDEEEGNTWVIDDVVEEEALLHESDESDFWYRRRDSRIHAGILHRTTEERYSNFQLALVSEMKENMPLREVLVLVNILKQLKEQNRRCIDFSANVMTMPQLETSLHEFFEGGGFSDPSSYHSDDTDDNGDLFNIIEDDDDDDETEVIGNANDSTCDEGVFLTNDTLVEREESEKVEHCESFSGGIPTGVGVPQHLGGRRSTPSNVNADAPTIHSFDGSIRDDVRSVDNVQSLFSKLCAAVDVLKRNLGTAFRRWNIPFSTGRGTCAQVQVLRWDQCKVGLYVPSSRSARDDWIHMPLEDALDGGWSPPSYAGRYASGRQHVHSLLTVMDLLLQGQLNVCRTEDELRLYWKFRCVLDMGYIYYFMALGETQAALDRINNLERFAEYRSIIALGSVNRPHIPLKRKNIDIDEEEKCSAGYLLSLCDSTSLPPLLVPLAIRIRILFFSLPKRRSVSANAERDAMEERIFNLVVELRRRMDGHPNRKVCRRVSEMLRNFCL